MNSQLLEKTSKGTIALFLNGERLLNIPDLSRYKKVYCVDGAYDYLSEFKIKPDLIIGDFDSIESLPNDIENIHTPDQNFTDFEKALMIIVDSGYRQVHVYAANGLEQDHFLGNMTTALKYKKELSIKFFDDRQSYYFIPKTFKINPVLGKTLSLFPFPKAKNVISDGLKYPLNGINLNIKKNRIGTRNSAIKNMVNISFAKGNILLFVEN